MVINKKAQIGSTLSWFVAFLIIFFILLIYIFACLLLAGKTAIGGFVGGEKNEIVFLGINQEKTSQRIIMALLESEIEINGKKMKFSKLLEMSLFSSEINPDPLYSSLPLRYSAEPLGNFDKLRKLISSKESSNSIELIEKSPILAQKLDEILGKNYPEFYFKVYELHNENSRKESNSENYEYEKAGYYFGEIEKSFYNPYSKKYVLLGIKLARPIN